MATWGTILAIFLEFWCWCMDQSTYKEITNTLPEKIKRKNFYKPTAFVKNDSLFVFYTANAKDDPNQNQLFVTKERIDKVID